jgi:hypothetical protein
MAITPTPGQTSTPAGQHRYRAEDPKNRKPERQTSTDAIDFTVRYAKCLEGLDSTKIRIRLGDSIYNVTAIDPMGFKKRSLKFKCEKVKR